MSKRARYASDAVIARLVGAARAQGLVVGGLRLTRDGGVELIDAGVAKAQGSALDLERDADAALAVWEGAERAPHPSDAPAPFKGASSRA